MLIYGGIVATVGIPLVVASLNEAKLAGAAEEVASALEFARQASLRSEQNCRVTIDAAADTLAVAHLTIAKAAMNPAVDDHDAGLIDNLSYRLMTYPLRKHVEYRIDFATEPRFGGVDVLTADFGGGDLVTFDRYGVPSSGGTVSVTLGGVTTTVKLDSISGEVTIGEGG